VEVAVTTPDTEFRDQVRVLRRPVRSHAYNRVSSNPILINLTGEYGVRGSLPRPIPHSFPSSSCFVSSTDSIIVSYLQGEVVGM